MQNKGWTAFSCFSFRVLILWMLAHCHTAVAYWDRAVLKLITVVTPVLLCQVQKNISFNTAFGLSSYQTLMQPIEVGQVSLMIQSQPTALRRSVRMANCGGRSSSGSRSIASTWRLSNPTWESSPMEVIIIRMGGGGLSEVATRK